MYKKACIVNLLVIPYAYFPWLDWPIILFIILIYMYYNLFLCSALTLCIQLQVTCNRLRGPEGTHFSKI